MSELKVSLIQGQTNWHSPQDNFITYSQYINRIESTDLIVLPEMWATGYTMKAHKYVECTKQSLDLMMHWAELKKATVVGSLIVKEDEDYYNRLFVVSSDGSYLTYDKRHLFAFAGEDRIYTRGSQQFVFTLKGYKIMANICYDLRFPVWARNTMDYDILLYVANWPNPRLSAWKTLLKARAIENQAYVIGVNCFGEDNFQNKYDGASAVHGPLGEQLVVIENEHGVVATSLRKEIIDETRKKFPFLKDRDDFELK